ncbi:tyrosine-type recombinase/integrase [Marinobacter nauticus]|uniref:tyrosine-type recombinase/integrase n=1 Tax=Marinobacter nauticus TaxID=2743 RepID=UPI001C99934C|nr:tyrosine-type recombinase/integrase [Marinobacter nauticus]MBY5963776.1 site-specific integrase [Marinobacter nauticus]
MPNVLHRSGALTVTIDYLWQKHSKGPYYYRRRVPKDIAPRIGKKMQQVALKTYDKIAAARMIDTLAKRDDTHWRQLREGTGLGGSRSDAEKLLERFNLEPEPIADQTGPYADIGHELFIEALESKVPGDATSVQPHLTDAELRALAIVQGRESFTLSDAKQLYLKKRDALTPTETTKRQHNNTVLAFNMVINETGDSEIKRLRRRDVSRVIEKALEQGLKTTSIRRRLNTVRAAINELIHEYELSDVRNPFAGFEIPKYGEDEEKREGLNDAQVKRLRDHVGTNGGDTNNIIGLLLDTGARISEVVGMRREDLVLNAETPHIVIRENSKRRLKTKGSKRKVPLVGRALLAAQRAVESADDQYLFPRYMKGPKINNESASATVNKALSKLDCRTAHCMRHTMKTRLANADVPLDRIDEIQGWRSRDTMAHHYGERTALKNMEADLLKSLTASAEGS